ncbi:anti-sigma factor domain-containing protein [Paenibacillus aurantiacus]|uniref:Anti-sigma-W factor RsiW n=1 Tax=Paenibacillus aurantiacus TaxID=1936118 RepID=A0ABV5KSV0_9BACL
MTYIDKDPCELLELYVMGGLADEEREAFELHLNSCESCRASRLALMEVIDLLPLSVEEQPVPAGMKRRVLSHVLGSEAGKAQPTEGRTEDEAAYKANAVSVPTVRERSGSEDMDELGRKLKSRNRQIRWLAAGFAAAVILFVAYAGSQLATIADLRGELADQHDASSPQMRVEQAVQLAPAAADIVAQGLATIVIDQKGTHLVVQAENLPELQGTEAYQVWLIKEDAKVSAGTFLSEQGHGAMYYTFKPQDYDTIAITLEPDALGTQPRGQIVLAAPL